VGLERCIEASPVHCSEQTQKDTKGYRAAQLDAVDVTRNVIKVCPESSLGESCDGKAQVEDVGRWEGNWSNGVGAITLM